MDHGCLGNIRKVISKSKCRDWMGHKEQSVRVKWHKGAVFVKEEKSVQKIGAIIAVCVRESGIWSSLREKRKAS